MSLYEALTLVSLWCGGPNSTADYRWSCQQKLFDCLVLDGLAIDRKNVIGCFKNTRIV